MTPLDLMTTRRMPLRLVIFDCDGVIVDSEPVSNRILAEELTALGWPMATAEATRRFLGVTLTDMVPTIEARVGRRLPPDWREVVTARIVTALADESTAIPGAVETLRALLAMGVPWRVASNSSHPEMTAKFNRLGIGELVRGRVHSHTDVARGKPAPELFLAAAAAEGVAPAHCLVVEDSIPGVRAAVAAGMDCLGFAPQSDGAALRAIGAVPFRAMAELPALIAPAWQRAA
jgi:HAD superfamily hydrolase (TIGR01509 family)